MTLSALIENFDHQSQGREMHALIRELYPICRSITGNGVRQTLRILRKHIDLEMHEVPSGTDVYDWTIPKEWTIRDAYVKNSAGQRVIDFRQSSLHIVNYSEPISSNDSKIITTEITSHARAIEGASRLF